MCGLVGVAGDCTGAWKDVFSELLIVDTVRGPHSTGAGFVRRGTNKFDLVKEVGHPFNLFDKKEYKEAMSAGFSSCALIGHNRFATIGAHTEENAHPFAFEHVMGAHNGTLDKWTMKDLHEVDKFGTDSEAIFNTINHRNVEETLKVVSGAWALTWYDSRDSTLNMVRNDKRPLHYCYSKDRCTIIWASETDMLKYVLGRRSKEIFVPSNAKNGSGFFSVTADKHYSWKIPLGINTPIDSPEQVTCEGKKYNVPFRDTSSRTHTYHGKGKTDSAKRVFAGFNKKGGKNNVVPLFSDRFSPERFRPPYKDMYGKHITKPEFEQMVSNGCTFCGDNTMKWLEFVQIMGCWIGADHTPFMCESCFADPDAYDCLQYTL